MKKIVIALMVIAIGLTCVLSVSALGTAFGGAETGQITAFFADFDPSALTEMIDGMDFSGILNDLGFGDIGDLLGGGDFDLSSLLGGIDLGSLIEVPTTEAPTNPPATTAALEVPTIAPSVTCENHGTGTVCACGGNCKCGENCTCGLNCTCNATTAAITCPEHGTGNACECDEGCTCGENCTCGLNCTCHATQVPTTVVYIPKTGESAAIGAVVGVMALAAAAYICTSRKKHED